MDPLILFVVGSSLFTVLICGIGIGLYLAVQPEDIEEVEPRQLFKLCPAMEHPMSPSYCESRPHPECVGCEEEAFPASGLGAEVGR